MVFSIVVSHPSFAHTLFVNCRTIDLMLRSIFRTPITRVCRCLAVGARQTQAVRNLVEDVDVAVHAAERFLAGSHGEHSNVGKRVHTGGFRNGQGAVDDESVGAVLGVDVVIGLVVAGGVADDLARRLMHAEVLAAVGVGAEALRKGVSRVPVDGEVRAGAVGDTVNSHGVLRKAGQLIGADSLALLTICLLLGQVLRVDAAVDVEAVAVVGGDKDQSALELTDGLQVRHGGADSVVEFEKVT